jgi:hypothetical protein
MRRRSTTKTVRIYEVVCDLEDTDGGPAGDGMMTLRFRDKGEAERCASKSTCWGKPAAVQESDVPKHLAERWGAA